MTENDYDWVECITGGAEYGAEHREDGAIRCHFPFFGTYWDVRFILSPRGAKVAIFPKGWAKAVYVAPIDQATAEYVASGDAHTRQIASAALELVCGWLKKRVDDFVGYRE